MSTFPFLSLPVLARNEIVKSLSLEDLIFLSTCSKRAYTSVKAANITLHRIQLHFGESPVILIEYRFETYYLKFIKWDVNVDRNAYYTIILNGNRVWWNSGVFVPFYTGGVDGKEKALELLTGYFRDLFKVNKLDVSLNRQFVRNFFLWKTTKTVNELEIGSRYGDQLRLSNEEIKFVLEDLNAKILNINVMPSPHFSYENGLKQKEVHIEKAYWLHLNALLNSESSRISLTNPWFPGYALNLFVKNWIAGIGLNNFHHLHITNKREKFDDEFQGEVLEDIETVKWDPRNRPEDFEDDELSAGRDFRKADGTWATVLVDEENFIFHVWK